MTRQSPTYAITQQIFATEGAPSYERWQGPVYRGNACTNDVSLNVRKISPDSIVHLSCYNKQTKRANGSGLGPDRQIEQTGQGPDPGGRSRSKRTSCGGGSRADPGGGSDHSNGCRVVGLGA